MVQNGIILVESDPTQIAKIRSNINDEFQSLIETVGNFRELLVSVREDRPQLVIYRELSEVETRQRRYIRTSAKPNPVPPV
jgi:hypothetical protein